MFTTSKHGSWLNQAEIEIGLLTRQCLGKRRLADLPRLCDEVLAWSQKANQQHLQIQWNFNCVKAREKFRYDPVISRSEH